LVYLQTTESNRTIVYLYAVILFGKDATANRVNQVLTQQFDKDGPEFVAYLKEFLVAYVSDSAAVMIGPKAGAKQKLEQWINRRRIDGEPGYQALRRITKMFSIYFRNSNR